MPTACKAGGNGERTGHEKRDAQQEIGSSNVVSHDEWGEEAEATLSRISERLTLASGARVRQVHSGVSVVLMRENGRASRLVQDSGELSSLTSLFLLTFLLSMFTLFSLYYSQ